MEKSWYKKKLQKACEEIIRLEAVVLSLCEDIRHITSTRKKNSKQLVTKCCQSIPWDDSDICAECFQESELEELKDE
tara:strand:+ start:45 stop:275 length:231 start_codon:yes stop_codon:yes gene_type:complete